MGLTKIKNNIDNLAKSHVNLCINVYSTKRKSMDRNLEQARAYLSHGRTEDDAEKKVEKFKEKLKIFDGVTSIAQARKLAKENFPFASVRVLPCKLFPLRE